MDVQALSALFYIHEPTFCYYNGEKFHWNDLYINTMQGPKSRKYIYFLKSIVMNRCFIYDSKSWTPIWLFEVGLSNESILIDVIFVLRLTTVWRDRKKKAMEWNIHGKQHKDIDTPFFRMQPRHTVKQDWMSDVITRSGVRLVSQACMFFHPILKPSSDCMCKMTWVSRS